MESPSLRQSPVIAGQNAANPFSPVRNGQVATASSVPLTRSLAADAASLTPASLRFDAAPGQLDPNFATQGVINGMAVPQTQAEMEAMVMNVANSPAAVEALYAQNMEQMKTVVMEKLQMINTPIYMNDPMATTRLLVSAFKDVEDFVSDLQQDAGKNPTPGLQSMISQLRSLQAMVLQRIRSAIGTDVTEQELEAMLKNDKSGRRNTGATLAGNPTGATAQTEAQLQGGNPAADQQGDPQLTKSAGQKISQQINTISQQAAQLIAQAQSNPAQAATAITQAMALLRQGMQLTMVSASLGNAGAVNGQAAAGSAQTAQSYEQDKAQLMDLVAKAQQLSKNNGLNAHLMITAEQFDSRV